MHLSTVQTNVEELDRAMGGLTLVNGIADAPSSKRPASSGFRFLDLPSEIRIRIYELVLLLPDRLVDLDPTNTRLVLPRLQCFRACKQMHAEAADVFYGDQTFRLFPMHGRFFNTKKVLLERLPERYRAAITSLEIRLGPGWSAPPRCQKVDHALRLQDCTSLRTIKVFVEVDPSEDIFNGFRGRDNARDTYKKFCAQMLEDVFAKAPSILAVEFDAYPSVNKRSPLVVKLVDVASKADKKVLWGPLRGWEKDGDCGQLGLENALASMSL